AFSLVFSPAFLH
ncbi:hypothetical protein CP8484711_2169B, partial [Chlamydia psittaci 84-8471/1]